MSYPSALLEVLDHVIAPAAELADRDGKFPRTSVAALGRAGLLGLTCPADPADGPARFGRAAEVVARIATVCPATAAVLQSHYAAAAVVAAHGGPWLRGEVAGGRHLCSLAVADDAEGAVRPTAWGTAGVVALRARKRDVVAAGEADSYIWSSPAVGAAGELTLWGVPAHAPGLFVPARPTGTPHASATSTVVADPVRVPAEARLGADGAGLGILAGTVEPWLRELRAAVGPDAVHPSLEAWAPAVPGEAPQPLEACAAMALR